MYKKFAILLDKNNKTAYQVSKDTGISTATLSNWKNGNYVPKVDKLKILADYFGVSIEYFLEQKGSEEEKVEKGILQTLSGELVKMELINDIAEEIVQHIKSRLPEEVRTYDTAKYILEISNKKIEGSKISYKE